jgi:site-specific recombinase XerD
MTASIGTRMLFAEFRQCGYDTRGWRPTTRLKHERVARSLEKWLQENRKKSILWANTKDLKAWLFSKPANATTRNHYPQAIVALYGFLQDEEYVETNHALQLPRLPVAKPLPKVSSAEEAHAVEQPPGRWSY